MSPPSEDLDKVADASREPGALDRIFEKIERSGVPHGKDTLTVLLLRMKGAQVLLKETPARSLVMIERLNTYAVGEGADRSEALGAALRLATEPVGLDAAILRYREFVRAHVPDDDPVAHDALLAPPDPFPTS